MTLKARDRLHDLAIACYPNQKKPERDKYHRQQKRDAEPPELQKITSIENLKLKFGGKNGGIGNRNSN